MTFNICIDVFGSGLQKLIFSYFKLYNVLSQSFAHGAMRECYRAKKLSKFAQKDPNKQDWHLPFANVVAKRYFKDADR